MDDEIDGDLEHRDPDVDGDFPRRALVAEKRRRALALASRPNVGGLHKGATVTYFIIGATSGLWASNFEAIADAAPKALFAVVLGHWSLSALGAMGSGEDEMIGQLALARATEAMCML